MTDSYDRPIWQIALKTVVTHAIALIAYSEFNKLLHVPSKHNARLFRLIVFAFVPTVLLGQFGFDIIKALIRILQNPHELDITRDENKDSLRFYWDGIVGVRSISASDNETSEPQREEPTRLLDLSSPTDVRPPRRAWNWKQTVRLIAFIFAILQAAAVIVLFVRRATHRSCREKLYDCRESSWHKCPPSGKEWITNCSHSTVSFDVRNLYIACTSIIASALSIYLLVAGNNWTNTPQESLPLSEADESSGSRLTSLMGEIKRLTLDFIIGAFIQEIIASEAFQWNDGVPKYPTNLVQILGHLNFSLVEWILLIIIFFMVTIFRNDIVYRLGIKVSPTYLFKVLEGILLAVVSVWMVVDAVGLVVTDIGHFAGGDYYNTYYFGERWRDPVEKWMPFI